MGLVKNPPGNAGDVRDTGLISGSGRSPGEGHGNRLQYSCLENPMDRGAWRAAVHRVINSRTRLKRLSMHLCFILHVLFISGCAGASLLHGLFLTLASRGCSPGVVHSFLIVVASLVAEHRL